VIEKDSCSPPLLKLSNNISNCVVELSDAIQQKQISTLSTVYVQLFKQG